MFVCLPRPRSVECLPGSLCCERLALIYLPADAGDLDIATAKLLQAELLSVTGRTLPISRAVRPPAAPVIALGSPSALAAALGMAQPTLSTDAEAYAVHVAPKGICLLGDTPRGRLWAVQTLRQLLRLHGNTLPGLCVNDAPAMRYRGVMLDVSRRKVPTVETLKALVDTLSLFKLNMLQLQVEHTFQWRRHPRIGEDCGSLSCEDIMELDAHCRLRGVELVPMLQSFGHMRNILMLDEYRQLAEHPDIQWSLCPTDPASLRLMEELYEEYLPAFSSELVNIGCDETFDLGRKGGRSNAAVAQLGSGRVYLNFILALQRLLAEKFSKRVMCWGDIILNHPELVPALPAELIVLNWWYDPKVRYDQVDVFAASGLPQIVCPGTNSWNSIFPRVPMGWSNVANFTRDGREVGALGMLNTDWGDGGHYNLLGCSYYSYAHGADASWAAEPMTRQEFEVVLAPVLFGAGGDAVVAAISALGKASDYPGNGGITRDLLFSSPLESEQLRELPRDLPDQLLAIAAAAGETFHCCAPGSLEPSALEDMAWAADAIAYAARKTSFCFTVLELAAGKGEVQAALAACDELLSAHHAITAAFQQRWFAGNRRSEIDVTLGKLAHAADVLRAVQCWLREHHAALAAGQPTPPPTLPEYQPPWKEDMSICWNIEMAEEAGEAKHSCS